MPQNAAPANDSVLRELLARRRSEILQQWQTEQGQSTIVRGGLASEAELRDVTLKLTAVLFATVAQAGYFAHRYAAVAGRTGLAVADELVVTLQLRDIEG